MNISLLFRRGLLPFLVVVFIALSIFVGGSQAKVIADLNGSDALFSSAKIPVEGTMPIDESTYRSRYVTINAASLGTTEGSGYGQRGSNLVLNLFPDAVYTAVPQSVVSAQPGHLTWHGKVLGKDDSAVTISVVDGAVTGSVQVGDLLYKWHDAGKGLHLLSQVQSNEPYPEMQPIPVDTPGTEPSRSPESDDGSQIDVLVVYTAASRQRYGGQAGIKSLINQAIAETNQAYVNSGIFTQLNLVHTAEVGYTESGNMSTDLSRLRNTSDGHMDEVHALRDAYKADMVSMIEESNDYCGIAYLMTTLSNSFKVSSFSVVYSTCATGYYSFGHELGHNMGSHHNRENASGPGVLPYSFGHWASDESFRTILAYSCPSGCVRVQHFSNPTVNYNGLPTGIDYDADPDNSADNARSINEAKYTIANWRDSGSAPPLPPAAPSNLQATGVSQSEIELVWSDNANNESGFAIERSPDGTTGWSQIAVVGANVVFYSDSGLAPGSTHHYRVNAFNGAGDSAYSNVATATTVNLEPPAAPSDLTATAVSQSAIDLHWTDNAGNENGFTVERSPNGSSGWSEVATLGANVVDYQDAGLAIGTPYFYRVFAFNGDGNSSYSNVDTATTWDLQPPAAPSDLAATPISQSAIDLHWTDNAGNENGFTVERSPNGSSGWSEVASLGANVVDYQDGGLAIGTPYFYRVFAFNNDGSSSYSNVATATTWDLQPPAAPSNLSAAAPSQSEIDLQWSDNSGDEDGFIIQRSPDGSTNWTQLANVGPDTVTFSDTGLSPGETHYYRIYAFNGDGDSPFSNTASATTQSPQPPDAPSGLSAAATSQVDIALLWVDNSDNELGFSIERSPDGSTGWFEIAQIGANATSFTDSGLSPGTDYFYRARSFNSDGYSAYSNMATARTDDPPQTVDQVAAADILVAGSVSGDYTDTWTDDGTWQSITERESGGKPANRYTYLEHKWTFDVAAGQSTTLWANVWAPESSDGDQFVFAYSTDDVDYRELFTVENNGDGAPYVVTIMQNVQPGPVYLRVTDSDRTPGHRDQDTIYVDHMFIRSDTTLVNPPLAPEALSATALSNSEISVSWDDMASDEYGFVIERKSGSSSWVQIHSAGANVESYVDSNLTHNTTYFYRIYAFNGGGSSATVGPTSATTMEAETMHIAAVSGYAQSAPRNRWDAVVTITVHDSLQNGIVGATVTASWSGDGDLNSVTCTTTDSSGTCTISKLGIKQNVGSVIFTVTGVSHSDYVYDAGANNVDPMVTIDQPLANYYADYRESGDRQ